MASRKRKRLSVWGVLARLGLTGDDHDEIVQHVFEMVGSMAVASPDGGCAFDGDRFLVETFESLGTTKDWPGCGTPEWERLRTVALRRVVSRLARDGLLDAIAVGRPTDVKDGDPLRGGGGDDRAPGGTGAGDKDAERETQTKTSATKDEGSDGVDATDGEPDGGQVTGHTRPLEPAKTPRNPAASRVDDDGRRPHATIGRPAAGPASVDRRAGTS